MDIHAVNAGKTLEIQPLEETTTTFDLGQIKLNQNFSELVGVKTVATDLPIGKRNKQTWICVSPKREHRVTVALLEYGQKKEPFIVGPQMQQELRQDWAAKLLVLCQTISGDYYWWPLRLPNEDGDLDSWNQSAICIVDELPNKWLRIIPNQGMSRYDYRISEDTAPPEWTTEPIEKILEKTVKGRIITSSDHPVVVKLRSANAIK